MSLPAAYVGLFATLAEEARKWGYALSLHGSFNNDFDIVAIPWTDEAIPARELIQKLHDNITYIKHPDVGMDNYTENTDIFRGRIDGPEKKPHGRMAWNIHLGFGKRLDVSVMPRVNSEEARAVTRMLREERDRAIYRGYMYSNQTPQQLAASFKLGVDRIRAIIDVEVRRRRRRDIAAGFAYPEAIKLGQRKTKTQQWLVVSLRGVPSGKFNNEPMGLIHAQWAADSLNKTKLIT